MVVFNHKIQQVLLSVWLIGFSCTAEVKLDSNEPFLLTKEYFSGAYDILKSNQEKVSYISLNFWNQGQLDANKLVMVNQVSK